ncbi:MAG: class I SAM-dependent methyltransferase [Bdellovibrionales bacterium]|nr:class I SAM-dependent methyltransferase [Bdellovibrionales bacterium]
MNYNCSIDEKNSISSLIINLDKQLGDRLFFDSEANIDFIISEGQLGLITQTMRSQGQNPIIYDIASQLEHHKYKNYALSKEPLYKAIGIKKGSNLQVIDATFGQGKDAMLLIHFGGKVTSFERNPYLAALILSDLSRIKNPKLEQSFRFVFGDPRQLCPQGDVLYYDPMYGNFANQKAKPRKEIQVFREVVGDDIDHQEFLLWAKQKYPRVVVKRPLRSRPLMDGVSHSFKGKTTRYDVYLKGHTLPGFP